jgi:hypothetical protein
MKTASVKITKTPFDMAAPVGKQLLEKCKNEKEYRKNWADKEIGQASKEIATHFAGLARGRASIVMDSKYWNTINRIFRRDGDAS